MAELYLAFLHDVEMVAAVALMEDKFVLTLCDRRKPINELDLLVLLKLVEHLYLIQEVKGNVASADAVLGNNKLEALARQHPSFTL